MTIFTALFPAKILLVDDHPMLRRGLKDLLNLEEDVQVVAEAENGQQALDYLQNHDVDLIVLDNNMPILTGIETLQKIRQQHITGKVILFTVSDNSEDVQDALELGADGYLLKDMEPNDIIIDIRKILKGELVISPSLAPVLAKAMRKPANQNVISELTSRERQVVTMIAQGMSNKMIGNKLDIAESTVKVHVKHVLNKTQLRSRVEVAVWAVQNLDT